MTFAIRQWTPIPSNGTFFQPFFYSILSFFAIQSYIYETDLHLVPVKNIISKPSCNWFKIDILWLLRLLIAIFTEYHSAMFIVTIAKHILAVKWL